MDNDRRKQEVIDTCLDTFIKNGLQQTSVRDLGAALHLQSGGIYYYFSDKDEAVIACAEQAALRLEQAFIPMALANLETPRALVEALREKAKQMSPTMRFFTSVCALSRYAPRMQAALDRLANRYEEYAGKFARVLQRPKEQVEPYVYFAIMTVTNYMIFGEAKYIEPQLETLEFILSAFLTKRPSRDESIDKFLPMC